MTIMSIEAYDDPDHHEELTLIKRKSKIAIEYRDKILFMHHSFENSHLKVNYEDYKFDTKGIDEHNEVRYLSPFSKQYYYLFIRAIKNTYRLPFASYVRVANFFVISFIIVLIFGQIGTNIQSIQNRNGVLFMTLLSIILNAI